jgi:succinate-acetate transporter protein
MSVPSQNSPSRAGSQASLASEQVQLIADPGPLGLAAFALTTFVLSLVNVGVLPADTEPVVLGLALAYGGVAQLLAGMWEFRKGNVFGATAFASFGAFWISFWAYVTFYAKSIPAEHHGMAAGWYLMAWGIFTALMFLGALRTTGGLALLFAILAITFFLLAFGALTGMTTLTKVGGVMGLLTAGTAWYLAVAGVLASTFGRRVLPNPSLARS